LKYLIVIALVALLLVFLYRRLRPYLKSARQLIDTIFQIQRAFTKPTERQSATASPEKLVQCTRCGIWIPTSRALTNSSRVFCSVDCLEAKQPKAQTG
jgi:hypothetical protein